MTICAILDPATKSATESEVHQAFNLEPYPSTKIVWKIMVAILKNGIAFDPQNG